MTLSRVARVYDGGTKALVTGANGHIGNHVVRVCLTRALLADFYGRHLAYDSTRIRQELGATFRPAEDVLRDCLRWILFVDALEPKKAAKVRATLGSLAQPDSDWTR